MLAMVALASLPRAATADNAPTLKVDPATQNVAPGQQFTVNIVQSATIETSGVQLDITFDPKLLQLKDFVLGQAYTSANAIFAFGNADLGTSGNKGAAMGRANKFGTLENVAGFLLPGSGSIPAGDTVFLTLTFVAQGGAGGSVNIGLLKASMLDGRAASLGQALPDPHLLNGTVVVGAGGSGHASGSPGRSGSPGASGGPSASAGGSAAPSEVAPAPSSPSSPVAVRVAPTTLTLQKDDQARIFLIANADGDISSIAADLSFDASKLQILAIDPGTVWDAATVIAAAQAPNASAASGSAGGVPAAIDAANKSGVLYSAGVFLPPGTQPLPYGEAVFVSVLVKATADGTTALSIANAAVIGVSGETIAATIDPGSLTKPKDKGIQFDPTLVVPLAVLAIIVIGFLVLLRSGRIPLRVRRRWPYYVTLVLGLVPVGLFAAIVATLVVNAAPVVSNPGIPALLGADVIGTAGQNMGPVYSIVPPLVGTVMVTLIAAGVALPISLVLAIVAVDFPMGRIGRLVRPVIAVLSGVPPIVYAVSVPIFVTAFMIPKFSGNMTFDQFQNGGPAAIGANPATWPPADVPYSAGGFPWSTSDPNSALLAGLLVGLFLIPFVTPLFVDALRDVPRAAREASSALGANRTYTLRRVVLPRALPAIAGASTLAVLKAVGDAVIVLFAVGSAAAMPKPPFDVLERAAPIGAWGANLIGSFDVLDATCTPANCAVGYTSALGLLLLAAVLVPIMTYLQVRGRRRVAV